MKSVISYTKSTLSLCICAAILTGCGGGGSDQSDEPAQAQSFKESVMGADSRSAYLEPTKGEFSKNTVGFYDIDGQGNPRTIRNDLTGTFGAMIQFGQSHTVEPKGNEAKQMPRLTSEKDALLLVTPTTDMGDVQQLNAEIYLNSRLVRRVALQEPTLIPASDQNNSDQRAQVQYSKRAWTTHLNWDEVKPGLNIRIVDPNSRKNGRLAANDIDFAAPGELLVQSIRLGLLSDPPSGNYLFLNSPEEAGADYLQTIPASKITVSKYDDMILRKVMVGNGKIYDTISDTNGDVYSGDMRGDTAKSTFSVGINLSNWGITSSGMVSQHQPQLTQSVVIHHARGRYQNGYVTHGLSGGNGILTLIDSVGNEFSHEIGHHYGLGHYPGQVGENQFWAAHHHDSGWGYISYRNRMRGNLFWTVNWFWGENTKIPRFENQYTFIRDSMSGGDHSSDISRYAHYTGYSTKTKIQPAFARPVWDETSPTGYKQWNASTRQMDVVQPKVPNSDQVWYNRPDGNYLKPAKFGVPVFTILGGYDPVANVGLIYPAARGNWGNVFNLPQADTGPTSASCWLNVKFETKAAENIALSSWRMGSNANKFHVNLAQSDKPKTVDLYCKKSGADAIKLSSITIPNYEKALPNAVIIGKEKGFSALRRVELPKLEQELLNNVNKPIATLSVNGKVLYDSYKNNPQGLSETALTELKRYDQQETLLYRLNRWVNAYRDDLNSVPAARSALKNFVAELGLANENPMQGASMFVMPNMNASCLKIEMPQGASQPSVFMSGRNGCNNSPETLWVHDAVGKIHSVKYPEYCLSMAGIAKCNNAVASQIFRTQAAGGNMQQFIANNNSCLDLHGGNAPGADGRGTLTTYGCNGANNQKWTIVNRSQNFLLSAVHGESLPILVSALSE